MDEEIKYIPYGTDEIDYNQFINNAANEVQSYVNQLPWSTKRKELFLNAYLDLISKGITGASNSSGVWKINYGLDAIPLETLSKKEQLMYGEAAYFLQLQMSKIPTKASLVKKEEDKKSKLPLFNNEYFTKLFEGHISKLFGGRDWARSEWNDKDERDKNTGLRGTDVRKRTLAERLQTYSDSLKEGDLNFEGSPFENLNDFKTKVASAIEALNGNDEKLIKDRLNLIGLKYEDYLSNGGEDPIIYNGVETTYNKKNEDLKKLAEEEAKKKVDAQKAALAKQRANQYTNFRFYDGSRLSGTPPTGEDALQRLNGYSSLSKLDGNQQSELVGAFRFAERNGILLNLSREELQKFGSRWGTNRLKKINGLNGFYWDSAGKRIVLPFNQSNIPQTGFLDLVNLNSPEALALKQLEKLQNPRQLSEGLLYEDYARMGAALGDIVSLGGFGANIAGSLVSLLGDTTADKADDRVSSWEAVKNFGKNLGWTAAGFIPGGKLGKVAKNIMRWAPKMLVVLNDYNLLNDESNKNTWNKLTNESRLLKEGLTDEDLKNVTYWIRAFTGNINAVKSTARDIKYSKARGTVGLEFTTKDGSKVTLNNKDVQEINVAGAKKGQKAAEELFKSKTGKDVSDNTFKFSENGRKGIFKNTRSKLQDLLLQGKSTVFRTPEQLKYYDLLKQDRNIGGWFGYRPFWQRGTSSYFDHFDSGNSFKNPLNGIGQKLNPYKNIISSETSKPSTEIPKTTETPKTAETKSNWSLEKINKYQKNLEKMEDSFLDSNRYNPNSKSLKKIDLSKDYAAEKYTLADGKELEISITNGNLNYKKPDGTSNSIKITDLKQLKELVSKIIRDYNLSIGRVSTSTRKFSKEYILSLKELRRKGYLFKQGGTIDNLDTEIKEILKTL